MSLSPKTKSHKLLFLILNFFIVTQVKMNNSEKAFAIGKMFVDEKDIIFYKDSFYKFIGDIWEITPYNVVESHISREYLIQFGPCNISQLREVKQVIKNETYYVYMESFQKLEKNKKELINFEKNDHKINLKDGIFDIETLETKSYKREDLAFYKLPFSYNPKKSSKNTEIFQKFLMSTFGFNKNSDEKDFKQVINFITEWFGYSLVSGNRLHKNLVLIGQGRNGKGVFQDIWTYLVGAENVSNLDLKSIHNEAAISGTKDKLINFSHDLEQGQQLDTGIVKSATSGEMVTANEKFKQPYSFEFTAKLIIACNELPFIKNVGAAVKERFYILPFDRIFSEKERDPDLKIKLRSELEGIFTLAIEGLQRLMKRGYFDPPERCTIALDKYLKDNDVISQWIEEEGLYSDDDVCKRSDVYESYRIFCRESGYKSLGKAKLYERVRMAGHKETKINGYDYFMNLRNPFGPVEDYNKIPYFKKQL